MKLTQYKKILVTHDGSEFASVSLPHAGALAHALDAELLLLQVVDSIQQEIAMTSAPGVFPFITTYGNTALDLVKENKLRAKRELEKVKTEFEEIGFTKVSIYVEDGLPQDVILAVAKREHCDMIVMSTHGRSGLERVMLGSVADHVIRHALCPVLVVHPVKRG